MVKIFSYHTIFMKSILIFMIAFLFIGCNHFGYTPHSKKQRVEERPSAAICDKIVDFRIAIGSWPISKQDFMYKDLKYYEVMKDFPYQTTEFKIKDSTEMTFYFSENIKDLAKAKRTRKIDINSYKGNIHFWKENGRFLWKINMK